MRYYHRPPFALLLVVLTRLRRFYKQSVVGQPRACSGHASALVGNKLFYLAGGMFDSGLDDLNILDTENFSWSAVKVRFSHLCVCPGEYLWLTTMVRQCS